MRNSLFSLFALLFVCPSLWAQNSPAVVKFKNGKVVDKAEFEYVYQKNNGGLDSARKHKPQQYRDYLKLYVDFRRKVMEAERLGLDTATSFKRELEGYLKQLAQPYMVENEVISRLVDEALARQKYEMKVYRFLVSCPAEGSPADTQAAYSKAMALRDSIVKHGKSFAYIASTYNDHPTSRTFKGYFGYTSVFDLDYAQESAIYNATLNQPSMPVRVTEGSMPGYYVVLVTEKLPNPGTKRAGHIIVRWGPTYAAKDSLEAEKRIKEVYAKLKAGEDFAKLAADYSDDPNTKTRGGDLGNSRLIPVMEEAKHALGKGQFSEPIKSPYGWHIMHVSEVTPIKEGEQARKEMKNRIAREARGRLAETVFMDKLKKAYNLQVIQANVSKALAGIGETRYLGTLPPADSLSPAIRSLELFTYANQKVTTADLVSYLSGIRRSTFRMPADKAIVKEVNDMAREKLLEYEETQLPNKYPDYKQLMREYRDGILLFTLTEKAVWRKAVEDTAGLRAYYESHLDSFPAKERVKVVEYTSYDTTDLALTQKYLKQGYNPRQIDSLHALTRSTVRYYDRTIAKGSGDLATELYAKPIGYQTPMRREGQRWLIAVSKQFLAPGTKSFEEAKSEAITKYQNQLERDWLKELGERYPVDSENKSVIDQLFKK